MYYKRGDKIKTLTFEEIFSYENIYWGLKKCCNGVRWKPSIQKADINASLLAYQIYNDIKKGKNISKGTVDFTIRERGKERQIQAVHLNERVAQK